MHYICPVTYASKYLWIALIVKNMQDVLCEDKLYPIE